MDRLRFTPPPEASKYSPVNKQSIQPQRMDAIIAPIAERHGTSVKELKGREKTRKVAYARFEAMHALMSVGVWSSLTVGQYLGRDHTTILHGVSRHEALREAAE